MATHAAGMGLGRFLGRLGFGKVQIKEVLGPCRSRHRLRYGCTSGCGSGTDDANGGQQIERDRPPDLGGEPRLRRRAGPVIVVVTNPVADGGQDGAPQMHAVFENLDSALIVPSEFVKQALRPLMARLDGNEGAKVRRSQAKQERGERDSPRARYGAKAYEKWAVGELAGPDAEAGVEEARYAECALCLEQSQEPHNATQLVPDADE
jgi:hypothetical protein